MPCLTKYKKFASFFESKIVNIPASVANNVDDQNKSDSKFLSGKFESYSKVSEGERF